MRKALFIAAALLISACEVSATRAQTRPGAAPGTPATPPQGRAQRGGGGGRGGANYPAATQGDFTLKDFKFNTGETMDIRIHYRTLGTPQKDAAGKTTNAVLVMHGTTGSGSQFTVGSFGGQLFGPGQLLDVTKYFIVLPDDIGHGDSSRPSEKLHAKFPKYGYKDMIVAEYRLLTEGLGVNHMRLIMGTSMGGMHSWQWGEMYPDYMDALMPLASVPTEISGRNRMWRKMIIDSITTDPTWMNGDYTQQPRGLYFAMEMMDLMADNPAHRYQQYPTWEAADRAQAQGATSEVRSHDANNVLYAFSASQDYNPWPELEKIKCPIIAVNTADDLINPPDIHTLEEGMAKIKAAHPNMLAKAVVLPETPQTRGHGSHTNAVLWKDLLAELLKASEPAK